MTATTAPDMTAADAQALLRSIGWSPDWTEARLIAATSKFGPLKFDRIKRALAIAAGASPDHQIERAQ